jgi:hypothetical protein
MDTSTLILIYILGTIIGSYIVIRIINGIINLICNLPDWLIGLIGALFVMDIISDIFDNLRGKKK